MPNGDTVGGIRLKGSEDTTIKPPLEETIKAEGAEGIEGVPPGGVPPPALKGKAPLHPAMIKVPLRAEGYILAEWTKWEGWKFTEEELNDFAELGQQLGVELNPMAQFIITLLAAHATRVIAYFAAKRAGKIGKKPEEEKASAGA